MKFIPCRRVEAPYISGELAERLFLGDSVESPVPLSEGDCFSIVYHGEWMPVFCSSSSGKCVLRRMRPEEIRFSEENGGDAPWQ